MTKWSLSTLLDELHNEIQQQLEAVRKCLGHSGTKGDASEKVWLDLFQRYLPKRYEVAKACIVDSKGKFSDQIDVVIFDRQYSPFIFKIKDQTIIPAESVYAVFEAKQSINAGQVRYAKEKIASVRKLFRTSLPIPYAKDTYPAKRPIHICGGLLTLESEWNPPLDEPLLHLLGDKDDPDGILDLGCIAAHGYFSLNHQNGDYDIVRGGKPATGFLFKLITLLQLSGTVPMIDIQAYAAWLSK